MAKVISFNTDAPALKTEPPPLTPEDWPEDLFSIEISGDYLELAGQRELLAWRVTASNRRTVYSQDFNDQAALFDWLLDTVCCGSEHARTVVDEVVLGEYVHMIEVFMSAGDLRRLGFKKPSCPIS